MHEDVCAAPARQISGLMNCHDGEKRVTCVLSVKTMARTKSVADEKLAISEPARPVFVRIAITRVRYYRTADFALRIPAPGGQLIVSFLCIFGTGICTGLGGGVDEIREFRLRLVMF